MTNKQLEALQRAQQRIKNAEQRILKTMDEAPDGEKAEEFAQAMLNVLSTMNMSEIKEHNKD